MDESPSLGSKPLDAFLQATSILFVYSESMLGRSNFKILLSKQFESRHLCPHQTLNYINGYVYQLAFRQRTESFLKSVHSFL